MSSYLYKDTDQTTSFEKVLDSCRVSGTIPGTGRHFWKVLATTCMCDHPAIMSPKAGNMGHWEEWLAPAVVRSCDNIIDTKDHTIA
jgi:hypothetical protein